MLAWRYYNIIGLFAKSRLTQNPKRHEKNERTAKACCSPLKRKIHLCCRTVKHSSSFMDPYDPKDLMVDCQITLVISAIWEIFQFPSIICIQKLNITITNMAIKWATFFNLHLLKQNRRYPQLETKALKLAPACTIKSHKHLLKYNKKAQPINFVF